MTFTLRPKVAPEKVPDTFNSMEEMVLGKHIGNNLLQWCQLLLSLLNRKRTFSGPFYVDLDITERCNLKCPGCPYHSQIATWGQPPRAPRDMDYDLILRIFKELRVLRTPEIILLGSGEPMLHQRFMEIVEDGKSLGFRLTVLTNGTQLHETNVKKLIEARLDRISVSLWDIGRDGYAATYGTSPELFDRIVHGLCCLHEIKKQARAKYPVTVIHFPISKNTVERVQEVAAFAVENNVNELSFAPVFDTHEYAGLQLDAEQIAGLVDTFHKLKTQLSTTQVAFVADKMVKRLELGHMPWQTMPCYVGLYHMKIKADGRVQPCCRCNVTLGNLHTQELSSVWNSKAYQQLRQETLSKAGLQQFSKQCTCQYCSFVYNNYKIHRMARFLTPFG